MGRPAHLREYLQELVNSLSPAEIRFLRKHGYSSLLQTVQNLLREPKASINSSRLFHLYSRLLKALIHFSLEHPEQFAFFPETPYQLIVEVLASKRLHHHLVNVLHRTGRYWATPNTFSELTLTRLSLWSILLELEILHSGKKNFPGFRISRVFHRFLNFLFLYYKVRLTQLQYDADFLFRMSEPAVRPLRHVFFYLKQMERLFVLRTPRNSRVVDPAKIQTIRLGISFRLRSVWTDPFQVQQWAERTHAFSILQSVWWSLNDRFAGSDPHLPVWKDAFHLFFTLFHWTAGWFRHAWLWEPHQFWFHCALHGIKLLQEGNFVLRRLMEQFPNVRIHWLILALLQAEMMGSPPGIQQILQQLESHLPDTIPAPARKSTARYLHTGFLYLYRAHLLMGNRMAATRLRHLFLFADREIHLHETHRWFLTVYHWLLGDLSDNSAMMRYALHQWKQHASRQKMHTYSGIRHFFQEMEEILRSRDRFAHRHEVLLHLFTRLCQEDPVSFQWLHFPVSLYRFALSRISGTIPAGISLTLLPGIFRPSSLSR